MMMMMSRDFLDFLRMMIAADDAKAFQIAHGKSPFVPPKIESQRRSSTNTESIN